MSLTRTCCCGKCFFGIRSADPDDPDFDDFVACAHNISEVLELKIPRPAHNNGISTGVINDTNLGDCPCKGTYLIRTSCDESPTIEVDYNHFQYNTQSRVYTWFYQKPDPVTSPLWPPPVNPCFGYDAVSPGLNDEECSQGNQPSNTCAAGWRPFDPTATPLLTAFQRDLITTGVSPSKGLLKSTIADGQYGDQYFWLQGVSNSSSTRFYKHWFWSTSSASVVQSSSNLTLERTILCVFHKEKWWERGYNSMKHDPNNPDSPADGSSDDQSASSRTPRWWVFACSGIPLYTWEIKELSSLTTLQQDDLIRRVALDLPVPEAYLDILESDGILELKDYGRSDGKIIKKTLHAADDSEITEYFFARPGGWTFVCRDFSQFPEIDIAKWPQISRRSRSSDNPPYPFGDTGCFTGAPIPSDCSCSSVKTISPPGRTGICSWCEGEKTTDERCEYGPLSVCGNQSPAECFSDRIFGNCKGCWIQYVHYASRGEATGPSDSCRGVYDSYLCRVPVDDTCDFGKLPDDVHHFIPTSLSAWGRANASNIEPYICCEGQGTVAVLTARCPAKKPNSTEECDEPTDWGPCIEDPSASDCGNSPGTGP